MKELAIFLLAGFSVAKGLHIKTQKQGFVDDLC